MLILRTVLVALSLLASNAFAQDKILTLLGSLSVRCRLGTTAMRSNIAFNLGGFTTG